MSYIIIYTPLLIATVIFVLVKHIYTYWDRQGIINVRPKLIYGNLRPTVKYQRSFPNNVNDLYWEAISVPYIGIYLLCRPALLIRDLGLIKRILIQDRDSFKHRGIYCNAETDPISSNLFSSKNESWSELHEKLLPLFATRQTLNMFELVQREGRHLSNELGKYANDVEPVMINLQKVLCTYTLNVIGTVFFGLDINLFEDTTHAFNYFNEELAKSGWMSRLKQAQAFLYPKMMRNKQHFPRDAQSFLVKIVEDAIRRKENNVIQSDVIQALLTNEDNSPSQLSSKAIAAQLFSFYSAGTQTLSHTVASLLTELLSNQDILDKLLEDIDNTLKRHHGEVTHEAIQEMSYLDLCLKETLRKSPPTAILSRECTKDYTIEETGQVIKQGIKIIIPISSIHNDFKYFKNPQNFMPERFLEENTKFVTTDAYLPFGDGSRQCPAKELGELIVKSTVVTILSTYTLQCDELPQEQAVIIKNKNKFSPHETLLKNVIIKPRTEINNN